MFRHNVLLIYRNFKRFKSTFFINLLGLSTGLACALLIYLWVNDELTVDTFNEKDSRLFQVMQNTGRDAGNIQTMEVTPGLLAKALAEEMPEIEYAVSVVPAEWFSSEGVLSFETKHVRAGGQFIGKDYFSLFSCKLIAGDKQQALPDKYSMAVAKELAIQLFGTAENAIGKTVQWNEGGAYNGSYHITGVFEKPPVNATAQFDVLLNYDLFFEKRPFLEQWTNSDPSTFVLLQEGTDLSRFNAKVAGFLKTKDATMQSTLFLQRYSDRYLHGRYENGIPAGAG
jgi:putative ABC transport system permease protein